MTRIGKVLVIGSGPIVIGQAAEFDYAGTQACKALREEGVVTVLANSNPATIMTDEEIADIVYIEPLTVEVLARIIERERPDGLLPTLGGQTGLNLAVELSESGVLDRYDVRLLGTPLEAIQKAEDRELFKEMLRQIGEPVPESETVNSLAEAGDVAKRMGFPLVVRPAYTLGGTGGGLVHDDGELEVIVNNGLRVSPIHQVLIERSLEGWKEIEYEIMRDGADNCITVCNMENLDPMGVHTGDSIVVAPSQTLSDKDYQMLRSASIKIIRALGVEGGCNVQFALMPSSAVLPEVYKDGVAPVPRYYVIEVNPRVSRSSALASKATGYPIARVAAKIAVGRRLDEVTNAVTGKTVAAFEPAMDYCVVKIPRWPFDKFESGNRNIGTQMKATGEVMGIDRSFEAALQKAVRSLEVEGKSLMWEDREWSQYGKSILEVLPLHPTDFRLWALMAALRRNVAIEEITQLTRVDPWFLYRLLNIVRMERRLLAADLNPGLMRDAKRLGFPDEVIATLSDRLPEQIRELRHQWNLRPVYKMVDTCAAEFDAATPYFYSSYEQENEADPLKGSASLVIGSGPIRIGQGIEFDYCSVHAAWALQKQGVKSIMVNSNPETVSTDFDTSDRLYFEPLDEESIRDILDNESVQHDGQRSRPPASVVQFGGQTAVNLSQVLGRNGLPILGSSSESIDIASDRRRFEGFLGSLGVPQPPGSTVTSVDEALRGAHTLGYPLLVRPSYVLGGRAMEIVHNASELALYMERAVAVGSGRPILIDRYLEGTEVDVDAICDGREVLIPGIMEHIERAGVHSGDAMTLYPGLNLSSQEVDTIVDYTTRIGNALGINGLMNIQFIVMGDRNTDGPSVGSSVYVIEVNPRASRTVPFISKVTGVPVVQIATQVMAGKSLKELGYEGGLWPKQPSIAIKAPVFSMSKLQGVDTYLGPEMKSTGEVMGIDHSFQGALIKALMASGLMLPPEGGVLLSVADRDKSEALPIIRKLAALGYLLYATEGTAGLIRAAGMTVAMTVMKLGQGSPSVLDVINNGSVGAVLNTISGGRDPLKDGFDIRRAAVEGRIPCFTSLDTAKAAVEGRSGEGRGTYSIKPRVAYLEESGD